MDPLAALLDRSLPVEASLEGHPLPYLRASPSWDTGERVLDAHLLYYVESGGLALHAEQVQRRIPAGSLILIPPGRPFRMTTAAGAPPPCFWRLRLRLPVPWPGPMAVPGCVDLLPLVVALVGEAAQKRPYRSERLRGLLLALLARLVRGDADPAADGAPPQLAIASRLAIERRAAEDPRATPRDLARELGLSLDYFTRQFRATYGCPPRRWLLEQRLLAAAVALSESSESAAGIARRLGFADPRRFHRHFRGRFGQTPGRFRMVGGRDRDADPD
jgi:AraC-like DNA-binding protein